MGSVAPQGFEVVEAAGGLLKNMNDDVDEIQQYPYANLKAFDALGFVSGLCASFFERC